MKLIESTFVKSQGNVSSLKVKWKNGCCLQIQSLHKIYNETDCKWLSNETQNSCG